MTVVSQHADRVVREEGDLFVKEFASRRARDTELTSLRALAALGVAVPRVVSTEGNRLVTERLPGRPLDAIVREDWASMPRRDRTALVRRVAAACRRIADGGYDWPDLVTYHLFLDGAGGVAVLDPARLRRGRLDLSALFWSTEEPTVSRSDRLRFWRAYAGDAPPPRLRRIGHRGRFRPYRWVLQRTAVRPCPPWDRRFVNPAGAPFASADEAVACPRLRVVRTQGRALRAELDRWVVDVTADAAQAERTWGNHWTLMAAGFRILEPAFGGALADGRGLVAWEGPEGLRPLHAAWPALNPRRGVRAVADLVRRLHACGLVHGDLSLRHLLVGPGGDALTLGHLARMGRSRSKRRRARDLASLAASARGLWSRADLLRGLRRYGGDRGLARTVLRAMARGPRTPS